MNRKLLILGLLITLFSIPPTLLLLSNVQDWRKKASGEAYVLMTTRLTDDPAIQEDPDVFGNRVVWQDWSVRNADIRGAEVNPETLSWRRINIPSRIEGDQDPRIYHNRVVWWSPGTFDSPDTGEIYLWEEGVGLVRLDNNSADQWDPDIWENIVVWEDWRSGKPDIYYFNLDLQREATASAAEGYHHYQQKPTIWEKIIVWQDMRGGSWDIYSYNIEEKKESGITNLPSGQTFPSVSNHFIVWQDDRNGNWDIYGYSLLTNETLEVHVGPGNQTKPRVSGSYIVFEDDQRGNKDVRGKNLSTGEVFEIANTPKDEVTPAIHGQLVVWEEDPEGVSDIILAKLRPSPSASDTLLQSLAAQFADSSISLLWSINQSLIQNLASLRLSLATQEGEVVETVDLPTNASTYTYTNLQNGQRYISTLEAVGSTGRVLQSLSVAEVPRCRLEDLNGNGEVDIFDLVLVARRFGADAADANFDSVVDLDKDGDIDLFDLVRVARVWGQRCQSG